MRHARAAIGGAILLFQVVMIGYARFVPSRYFCWAPYDTQTEYWISASIHGQALSAAEIRARYRRAAHGFDNRSPQHVIDILQGVEERRAVAERAEVSMKYRVNGKEEREWRWTPNR